MDTKHYLRALRAHLALVIAAVVLCAAVFAVYATSRDRVYAAHTQLFLSLGTGSSPDLTPSELYQGGLAAQSRVQSYARMLSSPPVADAVIRRLRLSESPEDVASKITATVPDGTVLIDVTVEDDSARRAQDIANALGTEFPRFVETLESPPLPERSPVDITVTSRAALPNAPENLPAALYVAAGALLGLLLGVGAAMARELAGARIRDEQGAESAIGAPVLVRIPHDKRAPTRPLVVVDDGDAPAAEAYRRLRTNLRVLTIDDERRLLVVTSAVAGEGKTLIAANLGIAFAQAGHRVVLVDADLRQGTLGRLLGVEPGPGLSELLSAGVPASELLGREVLDAALHAEQQLPLEVLASGAPAPNSSELLESDGFAALLGGLAWRSDIVIVDAPAVLPVSDAAIIAQIATTVLMVARLRSTSARQAARAAQALRAVGVLPAATALNDVHRRLFRVPVGPRTAAAPDPPVPVWGPRAVSPRAATLLASTSWTTGAATPR
jgi:capsular exopolysaccharide synthesis family protein